MSRLLFVIEDSFLIAGRGLVVVPGFEPQGEERIRIGDPLLLRRPDGTELRTTVGGIEMCGPGARRRVFPILLKGVTKDEAPVGTEVWSSA